MESYIDINDLLILYCYGYLLCLNRQNNYVLLKKRQCHNISQVINKLQKNKDNWLKVDLNDICIKILHHWGHGLNHLKQQVLYKGVPLYAEPYMSGGDEQFSPQHLQYTRDTTMTRQMKDALRVIVTIMKVSIGVGSVIVTLGAGGDTIVEAISSTINSGIFYTNLMQLLTTLATESTYLQQLLNISFENGPSSVRTETLGIINQIIIDGNDDQLDMICEIFHDLLSSIASVVGDWVSTFIPDDAGMVGVVITQLINQSAKHAYKVLEALFDKVPTSFQNLLKYPDELQKFLIDILRSLEQGLRQTSQPGEEMSLSATVSRLKNVGKQMIPGLKMAEKYGIDAKMLDVLFGLIKTYFEPNIEKAVWVVGKVMPLIFTILTFNEVCTDQSTLDQMKSELHKPETMDSDHTQTQTNSRQIQPQPQPQPQTFSLRVNQSLQTQRQPPIQPQFQAQLQPPIQPQFQQPYQTQPPFQPQPPFHPQPQFQPHPTFQPQFRPQFQPFLQGVNPNMFISTQTPPPPYRTQYGGNLDINQPYRDSILDTMSYDMRDYILLLRMSSVFGNKKI